MEAGAGDGARSPSRHTVAAGDTAELLECIAKAKRRFCAWCISAFNRQRSGRRLTVSTVKIVPDMEVAARTNMTRTASDTSTLDVSFDADVASRTNMQRAPGDVRTVQVIQDKAVLERTNVGDIARTKSAEPKEYAASSSLPR